jgi:CheY-like chemotaxis protein
VYSAESWLLIGDAERLQQVMWNLLSNAVKFNVVGGRVRVNLERQVGLLSVSVEDTGKGIDPEFLPYVFDRFKQADGSTTRRHGGLGLGLAIVRHIVELHGGRVGVTSEGVDLGSTFTLSLPVRATVPPPDPSIEERRVRPQMTGVAMLETLLAGARVLVVDDERDARELLELVLRRAGAEVRTADGARAGLAELARFRPHVIVSDVGMPEQDGYAFMKSVRALDGPVASTPAIALTAYTRREDELQALAMGFSIHLGKPVNPEDLLAIVADLTLRSMS